jgi:hypothetical protein
MGYTSGIVPSGWKLKKVTATGQALGAGDVFGGIMMPTAGTSTTVALYDDTSAAAGSLIVATTATLTAGQFVSPSAGVVPITASAALADGLVMNKGLWMVVGGTGSPVFWVLYK